jgi:hypothetical protein
MKKILLTLLAIASISYGDEGISFFEKNIRPLLAEKCIECHSSEKGVSKGGLTLDTKKGWEDGGQGGKSIVPGKPGESLFIKAIEYTDDDLQMPPKKKGGKLTDEQIGLFKQWIAMGAPDPRAGGEVKKLSGMTEQAKMNWSFLPIYYKSEAPMIGVLSRTSKIDFNNWARNEIDSWIVWKMINDKTGLTPSTYAEPEALLRRMFLDLVGFAPTAESMKQFSMQYRDAILRKQPGTIEYLIDQWIDQLLASPHYGERWGRHWLNTARYSDTTGNREGNARNAEYRYEYAWTYRDYVIDSFNQDKPFNKFIIEQLAADQLPDIGTSDPRLAALGFLTVGKRFNNADDVIDERIDTTFKAFMGLTVACARCHDHKFDPIPTADYYSMHGVFNSIYEPTEVPLVANVGSKYEEDFLKKVEGFEKESRDTYYNYLRKKIKEFNEKVTAYMMISTKKGAERFDALKEYGFNQNREDDDFPARAVKLSDKHPVLGVFSILSKTPEDKIAEKFAEIKDKPEWNQSLRAQFSPATPKTLKDVAGLYETLFNSVSPTQINDYYDQAAKKDFTEYKDKNMAEIITAIYPVIPASEIWTNDQFLQVFGGGMMRKGTASLPPMPRNFLQSTAVNKINSLKISHKGAPGGAMIVKDKDKPVDSKIYIRGEKSKQGDLVPRRFLTFLNHENEIFKQGSGRLELAEAIASKDNPMTARTIVNRVWMWHFGEGLVKSPDDLGNMASKPSNQELLDYLSIWFVENGWSLKKLHKFIMKSATYRQSSAPNPAFAVKDGENKYFWHYPVRRMDFESIRDSLVQITGKMDRTVGGKPVNITDEPYSYRRSIYGYVDRSAVSDLMMQFDFSDPEMTNSKRASSIVPQQALFFLNSPMVIDAARAVTERKDFQNAKDDDEKIKVVYAVLFQRYPRGQEPSLAKEFLNEANKHYKPLPVKTKTTSSTEDSLETTVVSNSNMGILKNVGKPVERKTLTPWEAYIQALIMSNEFVYFN